MPKACFSDSWWRLVSSSVRQLFATFFHKTLKYAVGRPLPWHVILLTACLSLWGLRIYQSEVQKKTIRHVSLFCFVFAAVLGISKLAEKGWCERDTRTHVRNCQWGIKHHNYETWRIFLKERNYKLWVKGAWSHNCPSTRIIYIKAILKKMTRADWQNCESTL